jgi:hypothetical protein
VAHVVSVRPEFIGRLKKNGENKKKITKFWLKKLIRGKKLSAYNIKMYRKK